MPARPRPSLRDQHRQLTREQILAAVRDAFAENGYRGATISDIARRARVGRATFYLHFAGKAELAGELGRAIHPEMLRHLRSLGKESLSPDRIEAWLAETLRIIRSFGPIPAIVAEAIGYQRDLADTMLDALREAAEQLSRDLERAGNRPDDLDAGQLTLLLMATSELMVVLFGPDPAPTDARRLADLTRLWGRVLCQ